MPALVIHAPSRTAKTGKRSFSATMKFGIGKGYAIPSTQIGLVAPKCKVVLLSKDQKRRAEGILVRLKPTKKAGNGQQRYDVHVRGFKKVPYRPERLTRNGIAII